MSLNIKLKRSAVLGSAPTAAQLEDGEVGVNYNVDDPALYIKNSAGAVIRLAGTNAVTDLWTRNGTTISPANAGDDVEIGGGNIGLLADGKISIGGDTSELINLRDNSGESSYLGSNVTGKGNAYFGRGDAGAEIISAAGNGGNRNIQFKTGSDKASAVEYARLNANGFYIGGSLPSLPNIELSSNGNVTAKALIADSSSGAALVQLRQTTNGTYNLESTAGDFRVYATTGSVGEKFRIKNNGAAKFGGSVSIGGTAAANTIDEYETGTFTPVFVNYSGAAATFPFTSVKANYTLIGNTVNIQIKAELADASMSNRKWQIQGIPFTDSQDTYGSITAVTGGADKSMIGRYSGQYFIFETLTTLNTGDSIFISTTFNR